MSKSKNLESTNGYDQQHIQFRKLFPNIITLAGLCIGLSVINFALKDRLEIAVIFIVVASVLDAMDGRIARMLNATSDFGAQLDSLTDFVNFGIAPGFLLYIWKANEIPKFGWALVLFFAICCAIRLARFNVNLDEDKKQKWRDNFFTGIPSPAGALMAIAPLAIMLAFKEEFPEIYQYVTFVENPVFIIIYAGIIGFLMASRLPTFSFKKISIRREYVWIVLLLTGLFLIATFTKPFLTLCAVGLFYTISLPIAVIRYSQLKD